MRQVDYQGKPTGGKGGLGCVGVSVRCDEDDGDDSVSVSQGESLAGRKRGQGGAWAQSFCATAWSLSTSNTLPTDDHPPSH